MSSRIVSLIRVSKPSSELQLSANCTRNQLKVKTMKTNNQKFGIQERTFTGLVLRMVLFSMFVLVSNYVSAALIHFKSSANVPGSIIYLKDIATVTANSPKEQEALQNMIVAPAPANEMKLSYDEVRSRMNAMGINLSKIAFSGSTQIQVYRKSQNRQLNQNNSFRNNPAQVRRAEKLIAEVIEKEVSLKSPDAGYFTVEVRINPQDATSILTGSSTGYEVNGWDMIADDIQHVSLRFRDQDSRIQQYQIDCQLIPHPEVIVTNYEITRGQILREADFTYRQLEKFDPNDQASYFIRMEDVVGKEASRSIQKGRL